jgi:hypothetical protein
MVDALSVFSRAGSSGGANMTCRIFGSVVSVGVFALATATLAQTAPQTAGVAGIKLAQATQPAEASSKTAKNKVKKKKHQSSGSGTASPQQPAPTGPDPGKY